MTRLWIYAIGGLIVAALVFWLLEHERSVGEQKIKDKDAALVAAQTIHNTEVERRARELAKTEVDALKTELAAPPAADAPHLRVCNNAGSASAVPKDGQPGPAANAVSEQPAVVSQPSEAEDDPGPDIDKRFADDDAIIKALQERIAAEVGVCR